MFGNNIDELHTVKIITEYEESKHLMNFQKKSIDYDTLWDTIICGAIIGYSLANII